MNIFARFVLTFRIPIIILFISITALFVFPLKDTRIDPDVQNMLPPDMDSFRTLKEAGRRFGGMEMALVVISADDVLQTDVRKRIRRIAGKISVIPSVEQVNTMPEVQKDPFSDKSEEQLSDALRERIRHNPMVYGSLVSRDFTHASVVVHLANTGNELEISSKIRTAAKSVPGPGKLYFGGMPFIREQISSDIPADMSFFIPAGLLITLLFLYIFFRQWRGVLLPLSVVLMSIVFSMGLVPLLGWKMMTVTAILPVMLIAVANNYGVHIVSRYQQENMRTPDASSREIVLRTVKSLALPVLATGLTTVAGFLCLKMHIIVPASQMGVLAAAGIMFALLASLLFIPAVLSFLPATHPVLRRDTAKKYVLEKYLYRIGWGISRYARHILAVLAVVTAAAALGILLINVESNLVSYYPDDHPVSETSAVVDRELGGAQTVSIIAQGDITDPAVLREMDSLEQEIAQMDHVGNTTSAAKLIRLMTKGVKTPDEKGYGEIPESRDVVRWYFDRYVERVSAEKLKMLVTDNRRHAQIIAQINSASSRVIRNVVEKIEKRAKHYPHLNTVTGSGVVFSRLIDEVVKGQLLSLILSVVIVSLLVMLFFRSLAAGLLSMFPLAVSLILLFGIMGYAGISLDIATAMLSSIVIGIGVDYTIHFLWHYRERLTAGDSERRAVRYTLRTTGRGIIFNAVSVMLGFVVLLWSSFLPIKFFGFLIVLSVFTCMIGAIVVLPAICVVFRPSFLYKKSS